MNVATIVEGDGEVSAVPVLLRRLSHHLSPQLQSDILLPIRVRRDRFLQDEREFRRMLLLADAKAGPQGWILVLLDADDDCPATLGREITHKAHLILGHQRLSVVLANREYEGWFIASARSLDGHRGFRINDDDLPSSESVRGAKEWMSSHMQGSKYRETTDQPAFSALMDLGQAQANSRSFQKLCKEWRQQSSTVGRSVII